MTTEATLTSKGTDHNSQTHSGQFGHEDGRQDELHVDAGRRCCHASKK